MIALDTNVLIYASDRSDPGRQQTASALIERTTEGVLLWRVAWEFVAASRKLSGQGFTASDAWNRFAEFQALFPLVQPGAGVLQHARELHHARSYASCPSARRSTSWTVSMGAPGRGRNTGTPRSKRASAAATRRSNASTNSSTCLPSLARQISEPGLERRVQGDGGRWHV